MGKELTSALMNFGSVMGDIGDRMTKKKQQDIQNQIALAEEARRANDAQLAAEDRSTALGLKTKAEAENTSRIASMLPALGEYSRLRGDASGKGRYNRITTENTGSFEPMNVSKFTGASAADSINKPIPDLTGEMNPLMSDGIEKTKSEDLRKFGIADTSPMLYAAQLGSAGSSLPADIKATEYFKGMQTDEEQYAKSLTEDDRFNKKLAVERMAAAKKDDKNELSINNKDADRYLTAKRDFETKLLSSRGQLGKQNDLIDRVDRDLSLIDGALSGKQPMTAQKWTELNAGLMNVIGGSISQGSLEHLTSTTAVQQLKNKLQYASDNPQNAVNPAFIKDVRESFNRIREITAQKREQRINGMVAGYDGVLLPGHVEKLKNIAKSYTSAGESSSVPASDSKKSLAQQALNDPEATPAEKAAAKKILGL